MTLPLRWTGLRRAFGDVWPPAAIGLGLILVLSRPFGPWTAPVAGVAVAGLAWRAERELARYVAGFVAFTALRYLADDVGPAPFVHYPIVLDRLLGLGLTPTERLQHFGTAWTPVAAWVYGSYFIVPALVLGLVWQCWPGRLRPYVSATLALFLVAAVVHVLLPTAPPWLAAQQGWLPGVRPLVLDYYHQAVPTAYAVGTGISSNPVAAMPSVHLGVTTLLACVLWPTRLRWLALVYLGVMSLAVIYSGDHYLVDVLAGMALALACWRWATGALPRTTHH